IILRYLQKTELHSFPTRRSSDLIFQKKEQGFKPTEAVLTGTKEVAGAVISSALTTIVVFIPIVLMDEEVGKMVIVLTVVVAVTLISSVIVAFTLIPVLSEN